MPLCKGGSGGGGGAEGVLKIFIVSKKGGTLALFEFLEGECIFSGGD